MQGSEVGRILNWMAAELRHLHSPVGSLLMLYVPCPDSMKAHVSLLNSDLSHPILQQHSLHGPCFYVPVG